MFAIFCQRLSLAPLIHRSKRSKNEWSRALPYAVTADIFVRKRACFHPFRHSRQHYVPTGVLSEHSFVKLKLQSSQTGLRFRPVLTKNVSLRYTSQKTLHFVSFNKKNNVDKLFATSYSRTTPNPNGFCQARSAVFEERSSTFLLSG